MSYPITWNTYRDPDPGVEDVKILNDITSGITDAMLLYNDLSLAEIVFDEFFMPYARRNWIYGTVVKNGGKIPVDCEALTRAFIGTWFWVDKLRKRRYPQIRTFIRPKEPQLQNIITSSKYKLFAPNPTYGNVHHPAGNLTGKCFFSNHTFCQIGAYYFDPTFSGLFINKEEIVDRHFEGSSIGNTLNGSPVFISTDREFIYIRRKVECGPFGSSYVEIKSQEALACDGKMPYLKKEEQLTPDIVAKL